MINQEQSWYSLYFDVPVIAWLRSMYGCLDMWQAECSVSTASIYNTNIIHYADILLQKQIFDMASYE